MSLWEMILVMVATAGLLGLLAGASNALRTENADQQTITILRSLRTALDQYHQATGSYPPEPFSVAVHYLQSLPESNEHLRQLNFTTNLQGFTTLADGYGRPLRYTLHTIHNQYGPDFVSSGPDGVFGSLSSERSYEQQAVLDNITGSSTRQTAN